MPRLPTSLLLKARAINPLLVHLLKTCRDLPSATNELRWLKEHVSRCRASAKFIWNITSRKAVEHRLLKRMCVERGHGRPLQYLLGTEYFGELELICKPGVLIPRPETADIVNELAKRLKKTIRSGHLSNNLRILDLCTGSGCMALLLHSEIHKSSFQDKIATTTLGVDISQQAIRTARLNTRRLGFNTSSRTDDSSTVNFVRADILAPTSSFGQLRHPGAKDKPQKLDEIMETNPQWRQWDIVVSNPPYISPTIFTTREVEKSVRKFEPRVALVPPGHATPRETSPVLESSADLFYPRILDVARRAGAKVVLMEVGGFEQAVRVKKEVERLGCWDGVEIWHDGISLGNHENSSARHARAVICWRNSGAGWLGIS